MLFVSIAVEDDYDLCSDTNDSVFFYKTKSAYAVTDGTWIYDVSSADVLVVLAAVGIAVVAAAVLVVVVAAVVVGVVAEEGMVVMEERGGRETKQEKGRVGKERITELVT